MIASAHVQRASRAPFPRFFFAFVTHLQHLLFITLRVVIAADLSRCGLYPSYKLFIIVDFLSRVVRYVLTVLLNFK